MRPMDDFILRQASFIWMTPCLRKLVLPPTGSKRTPRRP